MKKFALLLAAALLPSIMMGSEVAKGYVFDDANGNFRKDRHEKGIAGVAVSDGRQVVTTNEKGYYEMPVNDHCVIFVVKPKNYIAPVNKMGQPRSYYIHKPAGSPKDFRFKGSAPTGKLPRQLNFALQKYDDPTDFKFFIFGDPQPYSKQEMEYFRTGVVAEARKNAKGISFGISMGDLVGDNLDLQPLYLKAISEIGLPWYNVIGNHDRNYDATDDSMSNETFESNFGPSNYAFRYGDVHFIVLDDIMLSNPPKGNPYRGGLRDDQLQFVENYMKLVPADQTVMLMYHIPLVYNSRFATEERSRLINALKGHKVFAVSAHTHIQMQNFYGSEIGWEGPSPLHEYNVGTTCGDWYSGTIGSNGQPNGLMRDGTPRGYAIVTVKGGDYTVDYKVFDRPASQQMTIYASKVIPYNNGGVYPFYVNFYTGAENSVVEYRTDGGEWKKLRRVDEPDPSYMNAVYLWDRVDHAMPGYRPRNAGFVSKHLWKGRLDERLAPGEHRIDVRATDIYGRTFTESKTFRTESLTR